MCSGGRTRPDASGAAATDAMLTGLAGPRIVLASVGMDLVEDGVATMDPVEADGVETVVVVDGVEMAAAMAVVEEDGAETGEEMVAVAETVVDGYVVSSASGSRPVF